MPSAKEDLLESMKIDIEALLDDTDLGEDATVAEYAAEVIAMLKKYYMKPRRRW